MDLHKWQLKKIAYGLRNYLMIIIGLASYSLGWIGFLLPAKITTG